MCFEDLESNRSRLGSYDKHNDRAFIFLRGRVKYSLGRKISFPDAVTIAEEALDKPRTLGSTFCCKRSKFRDIVERQFFVSWTR